MERTIQIRLSEKEYEELEEVSETFHSSPEEVLKDGLKRLIDARVKASEKEFKKERRQYIRLEDWAKSQGL